MLDFFAGLVDDFVRFNVGRNRYGIRGRNENSGRSVERSGWICGEFCG
jgi:hypothetical protein